MDFTGIVESIRFYNEDNGFTVMNFQTEDGDITAVGNTILLNPGDRVRLEGDLIFNEKYGEQIAFSHMEILPPEGKEQIIAYLSSGLLPYIGEKTAEKIFEKFGEDALKILENNPERLKEIPGIGEKRISAISDAFKSQRDLREVVMFFKTYGISARIAIKLYRIYGIMTISEVLENPYKLSEEVKGIGFQKADEIARKMGLKKDASERIVAGLRFILLEATLEGDTYLPFDILKEEAMKLLDLPEEIVYEGMKKFAIRNDITVLHREGEDFVYLRHYHLSENYVAEKILSLLDSQFNFSPEDKDIEMLERTIGIEYAPGQREVLREVFKEGVTVITGGPGTGKTTLINGIIRLAEWKGLKTLLCAPTGRAAKRMSEATFREAKTIHRMLEYGMGEEMLGFQKNEDDPLDCDLLIVDEISMVNILLMKALMSAITPGMRLILVGDSDQLPSIGAGNVLSDLISSGIVPNFKLKTIFRQKKSSLIIENAHNILSEKEAIFNKKDGDFFLLTKESQEEAGSCIVDLVKRRLPEHYKIDSLRDIQVLSPMKKGFIGTLALNKALQSALNPKSPLKPEKKSGDEIFRVGDKVMQIKNNYTKEWDLYYEGEKVSKGEGVYNGDTGIILDIEDTVKVLFDGEKLCEYDFGDLDELTLSYAVTVHKSQGSEFPCVVMPIWGGPPMLLTRNLLYTAITRAKKLVVLVGQERYFKNMADNDYAKKRYSSLGDKIREFNQWM